ncbi:VOC family protein, partial [Crocinitomix catalasitica]|nr:VOC family protein [Crocinitomix catalasitica]
METLNKCRIKAMVSNLEASVKFYCETLGLELIQSYGDNYAEVQGPGSRS